MGTIQIRVSDETEMVIKDLARMLRVKLPDWFNGTQDSFYACLRRVLVNYETPTQMADLLKDPAPAPATGQNFREFGDSRGVGAPAGYSRKDKILAIMATKNPITGDDLAMRTGIPKNVLQNLIFELRQAGKLKPAEGKNNCKGIYELATPPIDGHSWCPECGNKTLVFDHNNKIGEKLQEFWVCTTPGCAGKETR